jgi:hypothetical protein
MPPGALAPGIGAPSCPPPSILVGAVGKGLFAVVDVALVVEFPDAVLFPVEFPDAAGEFAEFVNVTTMACVLVITPPEPDVTT